MFTTPTNENTNVHGFIATGWERLLDAFEQNFIDELDIGASCCVYHRGRCVADLYGGWKDSGARKQPYGTDTLQLVYSVSKGVMAAAVALCVDRGWLDYDAPVVQYWPEFGAQGKEKITVGQVLAHRAGIPCVDKSLTLAEALDWNTMTTLLAAQKPFWEPGTGHGYHAVTVGFLAGELIHRVDPYHRTCSQFIRDELDEEFYLGVSDDRIEQRVAPLIRKHFPEGFRPAPMSGITQKTMTCNGAFVFESQDEHDTLFNKIDLHRAALPAANGITNARTLARIYASLLSDVQENNRSQSRLISENTLIRATKSITPTGEPDQVLYGHQSNFAQGGFQLYSDYFRAFGPGVFGHKGMGGSCALAYPAEQLAFAHVCNHLDLSVPMLDPRSVRLLEAVEKILNEKLIDSNVA